MTTYEDIYEEEDYLEENHFELIEYYFDIGKYTQVIELIHEQLPNHMDNSWLWYMLGYSNYVLDNLQEAMKQLQKVLTLGFHDEANIFYLFGAIHMESEQWKEAEAAFLESLRLDPTNARTHVDYAILMQKTGHREKAKQLLKQALALDPENPRALRTHFFLNDIHNQHAEHIIALEEYMNSNDSEISKILALGTRALYQNNYREAKEYFRQAFVLDPTNKEVLAILEDMDVSGHPLLAPLRFIERIGGAGVIWLLGIGSMFTLFALGLDDMAMLFLRFYLVIVVYTWIAVPFVKGINKIRGR